MIRKLLLLAVCTLFFFSCTNKNPVEPHSAENITITEFSGIKIEQENSEEYSFIQTLKWETTDQIKQEYALKISTTSNTLPEDLSYDEDGWIIFGNSIWTDQNEFSFEFESVNGELEMIISEIVIQSKGESGCSITPVSFFDYREIGTFITTRAGDISGLTTGTGLEFLIYENINDIFVDGLYADHFMYRVNLIDEATEEIVTYGDWFNTIDCENIRQVCLNSFTEPALSANEEGQLTQFEAYVVTKSGYEDSQNTSKINFLVSDQFYPGTLLYLKDSPILGDYHYMKNNFMSLDLPFENCGNDLHYATPFWLNEDGEYCLIGNSETEYFFHAGWLGEYKYDDPWQKYNGFVYDETLNMQYFANIKFMDYRFDNAPLNFPGSEIFEIIEDDDQTTWLRIPIEHECSQHLHLANIDPGLHTLEVRVVDSQLKPDPSPKELNFRVDEPIQNSEKDGVLVITDSSSNNDEIISEINNYFSYALEALGQAHHIITRNYLEASGLHFYNDFVSVTDLQLYELVIYCQDYEPHSSGNFHKEYDSIDIYLKTGGNLLLSGGKNLRNSHISSIYDRIFMFEDFFGIPSDENAIEVIGNNLLMDAPYFIGADPINNITTEIDLQLPADFSSNFINIVNGLGAVAVFPYDFNSEVIYTYRSKQPGQDNYSPAEGTGSANDPFDGYDEINGLPVALKNVTENGNNCYLLGFPQIYMEQEDVIEMYSEILQDIEE